MHPPVFFPEMEIVIHLVYLRTKASGNFVGNTKEYRTMIAVIIKQHP